MNSSMRYSKVGKIKKARKGGSGISLEISLEINLKENSGTSSEINLETALTKTNLMIRKDLTQTSRKISTKTKIRIENIKKHDLFINELYLLINSKS